MGADRSQWQFPKNEANKIIGWRPNGKGLENKSPGEGGIGDLVSTNNLSDVADVPTALDNLGINVDGTVQAAEAAADRAEAAAAGVNALVAPADLTVLKAQTAERVTPGTSIEVLSSPGRFRVLAGSATSNGYTADGAVIVENDDGDTTFVRKDWLDRREVNALWFSPSTDGTSAATELQSWLDTATALAESRAKPAVAVIPEGVTLTTDAGLTVGSHVILGGGGTLKAHENLPLTDALIANKNLPGSSGQRQEENIQIRNITIDGSARVYPKWLSDPATGEEITDPEADYSSPGVIDTAQYGSGATIQDIVDAGRRNGDAPNTHGYLIRLRGVVDPIVNRCSFINHGSFSVVLAGCLNGIIRKSRWDNCGRIDTISPGILAGHMGSHRSIYAVSKANPAVITMDSAYPNLTDGQKISLREMNNLAGVLPNGTYVAKNPSGVTFELYEEDGVTAVDSSAWAPYLLDGRGMVGGPDPVLEENTLIEDCLFTNMNRISIQIAGDRQTVRKCRVFKGKEGAFYSPFCIDATFEDCVVDGIDISDIVANGFEVQGTGLRVLRNRISRTAMNGINCHGMFGGAIDDNWIFRSKHRGAISYPYGPFSERYSFNVGSAIIAGTAVSTYSPIDARSHGVYPVAGSIRRNTISDNRLSLPSLPAAAIYLGRVGTDNFQVQNLVVAGNDMRGFAAAAADLITIQNNAVDEATVTIRDNPGFNEDRVVALTANKTLSALLDSGKTFTNIGATAGIAISLPSATPGLEYTFTVFDSDGISVVAAAGEAIRIGTSTSSTNRKAASAELGASLTLRCISTAAWTAIGSVGTAWTLT